MHYVSPRLSGGVFYTLVYLSRLIHLPEKMRDYSSILVYYHDCVYHG